MAYFAKWMFEHVKAKCFFLNLTGVYMMRGMVRLGFKIEHTTYYDEYEFEGEKPFKDVKGNQFYNEPDRPGAYILAIYAEDLPKIDKLLEDMNSPQKDQSSTTKE